MSSFEMEFRMFLWQTRTFSNGIEEMAKSLTYCESKHDNSRTMCDLYQQQCSDAKRAGHSENDEPQQQQKGLHGFTSFARRTSTIRVGN